MIGECFWFLNLEYKIIGPVERIENSKTEREQHPAVGIYNVRQPPIGRNGSQ